MNWEAVLAGAVCAVAQLPMWWLIGYCLASGWYLGKARAERKASEEKPCPSE